MARLPKTGTSDTTSSVCRAAKTDSGLAGSEMARALICGPSSSTKTGLGRSAVHTKTARICALNDELRQHLIGGMAVMTPGVSALGQSIGPTGVRGDAFTNEQCNFI